MGLTKIQDEAEVVRWIDEGHTYAWMVQEYARRYDLQVTQSMFGNFRRKRGLERRIIHDDSLIPWELRPEHKWHWDVNMLRLEARVRAGRDLKPYETERLAAWKRGLVEDGAVVHYDADSEHGFAHVAPRPGIDTDLIRIPALKTTRQRSDG